MEFNPNKEAYTSAVKHDMIVTTKWWIAHANVKEQEADELKAVVAKLEADVAYWRDLIPWLHKTKADCRCLDSKTACRKCAGIDRYVREVGEI